VYDLARHKADKAPAVIGKQARADSDSDSVVAKLVRLRRAGSSG
jgi:hypothetical protein